MCRYSNLQVAHLSTHVHHVFGEVSLVVLQELDVLVPVSNLGTRLTYMFFWQPYCRVEDQSKFKKVSRCSNVKCKLCSAGRYTWV